LIFPPFIDGTTLTTYFSSDFLKMEENERERPPTLNFQMLALMKTITSKSNSPIINFMHLGEISPHQFELVKQPLPQFHFDLNPISSPICL
jgi:hypothetical protein